MIFRVFFTFLLFNVLVFAQKNEKGIETPYHFKSSRPLIYLDAGHGGQNIGAKIASPYTEEKKLALLMTHYTKKYLEKLGYRVSLTRSRDFFVPLPKRVSLANSHKADLFISLHFNSCSSREVEGIEVYYFNSSNKRAFSSRELATEVLNRMLMRTGAKSRGVKKGNIYVLRETKMPAILIEGGFLTNKKERDLVRKKEYLDKLAKGTAEGIHQFVKSQGF